MAKRDLSIIVCDVCEKKARQDRATGKWLHIPMHFVFGVKATKRPVATDLCSARCAKKWAANHDAFKEDSSAGE